jgi:hypothetical protein
MNNLQVDIETLGLDRDAIIIQIGAVLYSDDFTEWATFDRSINIDAQEEAGCTVTQSTMDFWEKEIKEGRVSEEREKYLFASENYPAEVAGEFSRWLSEQGEFRIWTNHLLFDAVKLDHFMEKFGAAPFTSSTRYNRIEDLATLKYAAFTINPDEAKRQSDMMYADFDGNQHDAVDDCRFQMRMHHMYLSILQGGKP